MKLSKNLTWKEFEYSDTAIRLGISNKVPPTLKKSAINWAENIFQPIRDHFGVPIYLSSGYRGERLNKEIGGSPTSQHYKAEAGDLDQDYRNTGVSNSDVFYFIKNNLDFDQLIWEFGDNDNPAWIHASYTSKRKNRKQVLIAYKDDNGRTKYKKWGS